MEEAPLKAVTGVCIKPSLFYYSHFVFLPVTNLIMLRSVNLGWHKSVLLKYFTLSSSKLSPSVRIMLSIN